MVKVQIPHQLIRGMSGFALILGATSSKIPRCGRRSLTPTTLNGLTKSVHGLLTRSNSYWGNSDLGSSGLPAGQELEVLESYRGRIPDEVFTTAYAPPATNGSGQLRQNLRTAKKLLAEAGWTVVDGKLTHAESGEVMRFEFLLGSPSYERVLSPLVQNLERLGVEATIRTVDAAQYQNRVQDFDFDIIVASWRQTLSPGNEQRNFWSSTAAQSAGSRNYVGIADPVIDELIERQIAAPDRPTQVANNPTPSTASCSGTTT